MEPLSPRSANIPPRQPAATTDAKARKLEKEKNHAAPPPSQVYQPPGLDGSPGEEYVTGRLLGKGGFAICHEAKIVGRKNGRKTNLVALKIVKAKMPVKKMEEKFRTELQIHSKMRHPNIVEFHRAFTFLENTYIVLELCPYGSIMDMVRKRKCLSLPEVRRYTIQMCGAIKYMHSRNVIHRDLKMGNLFLDQDMNLKIGDFGLAAILVTESDVKAVSRRTTLCGTPNYIAPEILERGKKGHDHKVDIWAVGVILFAMLTGYPPFASTSQDDIYRKVKTLDYVWPTEKCSNDIPEEAKSLVAFLLRSNAEDRPEPDQIVAQPFFSMHDCLAIPLSIHPNCTANKPDWLEPKAPRGDAMSEDSERISVFSLARECGVGHFPEVDRPFPVVGQDVERSLYNEFLEEEEAGRTPLVPLPDDVVYEYFASPLPVRMSSLSLEPSQPQLLPAKSSTMSRVAEPARRPADSKSHAARMRSEAVPVSRNQVTLPPAANATSRSRVQLRPASSANSYNATTNAQPVQESLTLRYANVSSVRQAPSVQPVPKAMSRPLRTTTLLRPEKPTPQTSQVAASVEPRSMRSTSGHSTVVKAEKLSSNPAERQAQSKRIRMRIASNVAKEIQGDRGIRSASSNSSAEKSTASETPNTSMEERSFFLVGPDDEAEVIQTTKPSEVMYMLRTFSKTLSRELESNRKDVLSLPEPSQQQRSDCARPVVIKWVDYTNKFGIGYILGNGTVGCVFNGTVERPSTCIVVPQAERHLKRRKSPNYVYKYQIVPKDGCSVEFIESEPRKGLRRTLSPASSFQIPAGPNGAPGKLTPTADPFESEKRRTLVLWDKFANYMTSTLGPSPDLDDGVEESTKANRSKRTTSTNKDSSPPPTTFIRFYQRLGNVGIWGYSDGGLQFNFPDHTKLVFSPDGAHVDFYHLSIEAAACLKRGKNLPKDALNDRGVLTSQLNALLAGKSRGHDFREVVEANQFREKVVFVRSVAEMWNAGGGLVRGSGDKAGMKWEGMRELGPGGKEKLVWVTVGAKGSDVRISAPV